MLSLPVTPPVTLSKACCHVGRAKEPQTTEKQLQTLARTPGSIPTCQRMSKGYCGYESWISAQWDPRKSQWRGRHGYKGPQRACFCSSLPQTLHDFSKSVFLYQGGQPRVFLVLITDLALRDDNLRQNLWTSGTQCYSAIQRVKPHAIPTSS